MNQDLAIDFLKPIKVLDWVTDEVLGEFSAVLGIHILNQSQRWDTNHCTENVRCHRRWGDRPIIFTQV